MTSDMHGGDVSSSEYNLSSQSSLYVPLLLFLLIFWGGCWLHQYCEKYLRWFLNKVVGFNYVPSRIPSWDAKMHLSIKVAMSISILMGAFSIFLIFSPTTNIPTHSPHAMEAPEPPKSAFMLLSRDMSALKNVLHSGLLISAYSTFAQCGSLRYMIITGLALILLTLPTSGSVVLGLAQASTFGSHSLYLIFPPLLFCVLVAWLVVLIWQLHTSAARAIDEAVAELGPTLFETSGSIEDTTRRGKQREDSLALGAFRLFKKVLHNGQLDVNKYFASIWYLCRLRVGQAKMVLEGRGNMQRNSGGVTLFERSDDHEEDLEAPEEMAGERPSVVFSAKFHGLRRIGLWAISAEATWVILWEVFMVVARLMHWRHCDYHLASPGDAMGYPDLATNEELVCVSSSFSAFNLVFMHSYNFVIHHAWVLANGLHALYYAEMSVVDIYVLAKIIYVPYQVFVVLGLILQVAHGTDEPGVTGNAVWGLGTNSRMLAFSLIWQILYLLVQAVGLWYVVAFKRYLAKAQYSFSQICPTPHVIVADGTKSLMSLPGESGTPFSRQMSAVGVPRTALGAGGVQKDVDGMDEKEVSGTVVEPPANPPRPTVLHDFPADIDEKGEQAVPKEASPMRAATSPPSTGLSLFSRASGFKAGLWLIAVTISWHLEPLLAMYVQSSSHEHGDDTVPTMANALTIGLHAVGFLVIVLHRGAQGTRAQILSRKTVYAYISLTIAIYSAIASFAMWYRLWAEKAQYKHDVRAYFDKHGGQFSTEHPEFARWTDAEAVAVFITIARTVSSFMAAYHISRIDKESGEATLAQYTFDDEKQLQQNDEHILDRTQLGNLSMPMFGMWRKAEDGGYYNDAYSFKPNFVPLPLHASDSANFENADAKDEKDEDLPEEWPHQHPDACCQSCDKVCRPMCMVPCAFMEHRVVSTFSMPRLASQLSTSARPDPDGKLLLFDWKRCCSRCCCCGALCMVEPNPRHPSRQLRAPVYPGVAVNSAYTDVTAPSDEIVMVELQGFETTASETKGSRETPYELLLRNPLSMRGDLLRFWTLFSRSEHVLASADDADFRTAKTLIRIQNAPYSLHEPLSSAFYTSANNFERIYAFYRKHPTGLDFSLDRDRLRAERRWRRPRKRRSNKYSVIDDDDSKGTVDIDAKLDVGDPEVPADGEEVAHVPLGYEDSHMYAFHTLTAGPHWVSLRSILRATKFMRVNIGRIVANSMLLRDMHAKQEEEEEEEKKAEEGAVEKFRDPLVSVPSEPTFVSNHPAAPYTGSAFTWMHILSLCYCVCMWLFGVFLIFQHRMMETGGYDPSSFVGSESGYFSQAITYPNATLLPHALKHADGNNTVDVVFFSMNPAHGHDESFEILFHFCYLSFGFLWRTASARNLLFAKSSLYIVVSNMCILLAFLVFHVFEGGEGDVEDEPLDKQHFMYPIEHTLNQLYLSVCFSPLLILCIALCGLLMYLCRLLQDKARFPQGDHVLL